MPLITRRSSTRGTPRGLFGSNGRSRSHCLSLNQNSLDNAHSRSIGRLNHIPAAIETLFMGPGPKALIDAGVMRGGNALHAAATATTVRVRDGQRDLHDGPYADSKEELGGYFIIEVDTLDEALLWAARNPAASSGAVEVRPVLSH